jgi:uncharacterized cupredoxin-like copper-binding protein
MLMRSLVLGGVIVFLLAACSGTSTEVQALDVVASGMRFEPSSLEVMAGQPVRLTLTNNDALEHDFSIKEFPVEGSVQSDGHAGHDISNEAERADLHVGAATNASGTIEFTPSKPGTYEFYCAVPGHKEAGMVGSLVVNAP